MTVTGTLAYYPGTRGSSRVNSTLPAHHLEHGRPRGVGDQMRRLSAWAGAR
jgi:hypothetical protein